jgi:phosphatidylglycerophosphate synthase
MARPAGRDRAPAAEATMSEHEFRQAQREIHGFTAPLERRALAWLAARMPPWVTPDKLTLLGLGAMLAAGLAYWQSAARPWCLHLVNLALVVNWFGDSLDGTVARFRGKTRPRYGFYVDHMVDAFGVLALLAGLAASGHMRPAVAAVLLIAYYLVTIQTCLAAYAVGVFRISYGLFGGTELRLLLIVGNLFLLERPRVTLLGHHWLLFDVGGAVGAAGLLAIALVQTAVNTVRLYRQERV